ncbi:MAG: hypothetical protein EOP10_08140 [Proteobacteria bacterium]|nr:MAG: hypothetical protein EOP10_08140 [Pseudomonadota bacterium]
MTSLPQKQDVNDGPILWPSVGFYFGALKRQGPLALLISLPVLLLVMFGITRLPPEFSSQIVVVYDTFTAESALGNGDFLITSNRISTAFQNSFTNPEYLQNVLDRLPKDEKTETSGPSMTQKIKSLLAGDMFSEGKGQTPEEKEREALQEGLSKSLLPEANLAQLSLSITAKDRTPQAAQLKARTAMEQVIVNELSFRRKNTVAKIQELSAREAKYLREKEEFPELGSTFQDTSAKDEVSPQRQRELKSLEQRVVKDLLNARADYDRAKANHDQSILALDTQLNNLQSRKGTEHPEVIQKSRELEKIRTSPTWGPIEREMNVLKTKLSEVQREMVSLGLPIDRSAQIAFFSTDMQATLSLLSGQIRTLEVLADSLKTEIAEPWNSRHFTLVRDANVSSSPSNKKQYLLAAGVGLALVLMVFLLVVVCREFFQPNVVATEQIVARYAIPEDRVVEVNRSWLKSIPPFTLEKIRLLKPQLSALPSRGRPELFLLDAFRHLAQLVEQMPQHQVITFFDTGFKTNTNNVALNLAQVLSADSGRRVLYLSFRSDLKSQVSESGDLMDFLSGQVEWKDVRLKGDGGNALDQAYAQDPSKTLSNFQEETLIRLFKILREKYSLIVIDALLPIYNTENGILHKLSDSVVLQVRLNESRDADIGRLLQFLDRSKIAATIVSK